MKKRILVSVAALVAPVAAFAQNGNGNALQGMTLFQTVKAGGKLMPFIIGLGVLGLTIIIERVIYFARHDIWTQKGLRARLEKAAAGSTAKFREEFEEEMRNSFQMFASTLEKGMGLLSGCGNLAPVLGFLGTVVGMIDAFAAIAAATTVNAKVVAVGIQVALITTATGLVVAAPILFFYYVFTHVIQNRYIQAEEIIAELSQKLPRMSEKLTD
jgi:hypothetical protein